MKNKKKLTYSLILKFKYCIIFKRVKSKIMYFDVLYTFSYGNYFHFLWYFNNTFTHTCKVDSTTIYNDKFLRYFIFVRRLFRRAQQEYKLCPCLYLLPMRTNCPFFQRGQQTRPIDFFKYYYYLFKAACM